MDVDQKTLERIAGALERIAKVLEAIRSTNASAIHKNEIVDAVKTVGSLAAEAVGHGGTLTASAKAAPEKQVHAGVAKAIGAPAKKAAATKTAPVPKPVAKKTPSTPSNKAKKKMAELRKTPAGQQLSDFFVKLGLTILNPDSLEPKVEHPKLANAIWQ